MPKSNPESTFTFAGRKVHRMGYGAMQLAGPGVWGPPRDPDAAVAVLREAVAAGVNHIDTSGWRVAHAARFLRQHRRPLASANSAHPAWGWDALQAANFAPQLTFRSSNGNVRVENIFKVLVSALGLAG